MGPMKCLPSPLKPELFCEASIKSLKKYHENSQPYTHLVLDSLCIESRMVKVQHEAKHNLTANYKETDLFKVYQTGELGNFDSSDKTIASQFPELLSLRDAIYSKEFREFISEVMGLDDLTERVDCSCNAYTQGCHLICHDDGNQALQHSHVVHS